MNAESVHDEFYLIRPVHLLIIPQPTDALNKIQFVANSIISYMFRHRSAILREFFLEQVQNADLSTYNRHYNYYSILHKIDGDRGSTVVKVLC